MDISKKPKWRTKLTKKKKFGEGIGYAIKNIAVQNIQTLTTRDL